MTQTSAVNLIWFRDDLRITDNPALSAAMEAGPSAALYILDEDSPGVRPLGGAARWWLHHALEDLREQLADLGVPLLLYRGKSVEIFSSLSERLGVSQVHWNRRYSLAERNIDAAVKDELRQRGITIQSHCGSLLVDPWQISNGQGGPYKVFAAFHRRLVDISLRPSATVPEPQQQLRDTPLSTTLNELELIHRNSNWSQKLHQTWKPGESSARQVLAQMLEQRLSNYAQLRDRPDQEGTSRLSPALRWGHLSPQQVFVALSPKLTSATQQEGAAALRRQLIWREFCWHLLYHFPHIAQENFRPEFDGMDWGEPHTDELAAYYMGCWQTGRTGFGMVDAGMRQLWDTGWMHNRARMLTASFLVKNLQIHWKAGERWFWDTLVDADLASNVVNWQWVAGSGTDAAPYFRIFNPELQGKKFDPYGAYVSRYAPRTGQPIVDLKKSRTLAIEAYTQVSERRGRN